MTDDNHPSDPFSDSGIIPGLSSHGGSGHSGDKPRSEKVLHFIMGGAATVVILAGIKAASGIVGPMLLALFLTIILLVPLRWLRKKGCPNILSLIIVLGGTVVVFLGVGYLVGKSLNDLSKSIPTYRARILRKLDEFDKKMEQFGFALGLQPEGNGENVEHKPVIEQVVGRMGDSNHRVRPTGDTVDDDSPIGSEASHSDIPPAIVSSRPSDPDAASVQPAEGDPTEKQSFEDDPSQDEFEDPDDFRFMFESQHSIKPPPISLDAKSTMYWITKLFVELRHLAEGGFLVLIFTIFMIFEASRFPEKVDSAFGKEGPINNEHFHRIANDIRTYLFLKAISSLMSALAATFVYWIFGVPATLFWGVVAFFLYFIPNVGGTLAAIVPGLLIFMTYDIEGVLLYAVCLIAIECSIAYGIEPRMLGHGLGISTVVIILSLFSWGWLLGPIGLFLAAPLTIMVKIILQAFKETEWIAILLSDKARN